MTSRWLLIALSRATAFSGGGGSGETDDGSPILQTCDALSLCTIPDASGTFHCPDGMHLVAPPTRSDVYVLATEDGSTSYVPGQLVPLIIAVTQKQIVGWQDRGMTNTSLESSKYIGLLLYAVQEGDATETKMGDWEVPIEVPARFWLPPDPGCAAKAVMHASASPKSYLERFVFRAPAAGTGTLTFRALVKQGDTNAGAFYWLGGGGGVPSAGSAGGDLTLTEASAPSAEGSTAWIRAADGLTCAEACAARADDATCDEEALSAVQQGGADAFDDAGGVRSQQLCREPLLLSCDGPSASRLADAYCWYSTPAECNTSPDAPTSLCEAAPREEAALGTRLCACTGGGRRRALSEQQQRSARESEAEADGRAGAGAVTDAGEGTGTLAGWLANFVEGLTATETEAAQTAEAEAMEAGDSVASLAVKGGCPNARLAASRRLGAGAGVAQPPCPSGARALAKRSATSAATPEWVAAVTGPFPRRLAASMLSTPLLALAVAAMATVGTLGAVVGLAHRRAKVHRRQPAPGGGGGGVGGGGHAHATVGLLALLADVASSHNWINAPRSRTGKLSLTAPCPKRTRFSHPDIIVNRGQPFEVEWQVGHPRSHNFFTLVRAEDEAMLATQTEAMLWEYLADAADDAETYEGEYWEKYHVGYQESASKGTDANFEAQGRTKLANDDDLAPKRPWAFECPYSTVVDPNRTDENPGCGACNSGPTGISGYCATVARWRYAAVDVSSDRAAAYYNAKYPWIQAVHHYKNPRNHWPKQFDIARLAFPTHTQAFGQHIVHWMWRGCTPPWSLKLLISRSFA